MSGCVIRPFSPAEIPIAAALHARCFPHEPWNSAAMAALAGGPGGLGLLALEQGQPLGLLLARLAADEAEILTLGVAPEARRRGLARALLAAAAERLGQAGARRLQLEVAEDNLTALALYRASGFAVVGRRPSYYRRIAGTAVAAVLLARDLLGSGTKSA
ncbi:MAG: GNAT family N-acetyltransferase [Kiloniellales bacterium]